MGVQTLETILNRNGLRFLYARNKRQDVTCQFLAISAVGGQKTKVQVHC